MAGLKLARPTPSGKKVNRIVSRLPGVQDAVDDKAQGIATRAEANLRGPDSRGRHTIDVERGITDRYVDLHGPGAMALEYGHHNSRSGEYVEGKRVMRDAARG